MRVGVASGKNLLSWATSPPPRGAKVQVGLKRRRTILCVRQLLHPAARLPSFLAVISNAGVLPRKGLQGKKCCQGLVVDHFSRVESKPPGAIIRICGPAPEIS